MNKRMRIKWHKFKLDMHISQRYPYNSYQIVLARFENERGNERGAQFTEPKQDFPLYPKHSANKISHCQL